MSNTHETTTRTTLPSNLAKQVQSQFSAFSSTDLTGYTVQRTRSDFQGAKTDLTIFDSDGKLRLMGRDFGDRTFFWQP